MMLIVSNEEIGRNIRFYRKKANLSLIELGELVGLHKSTVSRYEKGKISSLDITMIKNFANALNVHISDLVNTDDAVDPPNPLIDELTEKASHLSDEQLKQVIAIVDTFKAQKKGP